MSNSEQKVNIEEIGTHLYQEYAADSIKVLKGLGDGTDFSDKITMLGIVEATFGGQREAFVYFLIPQFLR